ncbi:MAG TPA: class I SAM-dependent methyltransferase, partial [Patescibacteria group bacterium]|nr:class I SAM-dependent methyltransferase [Patescibacteria group bacterium]
ISEASLIEAKKIYPQVMEVDVSKKIPFPNKHFDFVFCSEVFGHIEKKDKEKFMRELHRVLKPGGFVFFSIETLGNNKLTSFLKRKKLYKKYWIDYQGHIGLESPRKTLGRFQDKFTILTSRMTSSHILPIDGYLTFREEYKILAIFKNDFIRRSLNILLFPVFYTTIRLSDFDTANDIVIVGQKTPPTSKK